MYPTSRETFKNMATFLKIFKSKLFPYFLILILATVAVQYARWNRSNKKEVKTLTKEKKAIQKDYLAVNDSLQRLLKAKVQSDTTVFNYKDSTIYQFKNKTFIDTVIYDSVAGGMFLLTYKPLTINTGKFNYQLPITYIKERSIVWEQPHLYLTGGLATDFNAIKYSIGLMYINKKYGFGMEYERLVDRNFYKVNLIYRIK